VAAFGDTAKPMAERIAPLRQTLSAASDPVQQQAIFEQAVDAGMPRLLAPTLAAYGRGDVDAAGRLLRAALDEPAERGTSPRETSAVNSSAASPLALRGAALPRTRPAGLGNQQIDLAPSIVAQLAREDAAGGDFDSHPLTLQLHDRLIHRNLLTNGGDYPAADALAKQDLRLPTNSRYAQSQPRILSDAAVDGGAVVTSPSGPKVDSLSGKTILTGPQAVPPDPANLNEPGKLPAPPGLPPAPNTPAAVTYQCGPIQSAAKRRTCRSHRRHDR